MDFSFPAIRHLQPTNAPVRIPELNCLGRSLQGILLEKNDILDSMNIRRDTYGFQSKN